LAVFLNCTLKTRWLGGSFLMVYRNNVGRLGSGFISVCLQIRWLGPKSGFYVPDQYCSMAKEGGRDSGAYNKMQHLGATSAYNKMQHVGHTAAAPPTHK